MAVYEAGDAPGGQVRWAATVPNRAEFGDIIRNQTNELRRLEVKIVFHHRVDEQFVEQERPDSVIVATGSEPSRPYWAPGDAGRIIDVLDVLQGSAAPQPGEKVVIVDELGFHQATSVAEVLADRGCRVQILTNSMVVGQDLGITLDMENFLIRAAAKGIELTPDSVVMGWNAESSSLSVLHHVSGRMNDLTADWVVLAVPGRPVDELYLALKQRGVAVVRVGDCVAPRRVHAAVIEGDRVGAQP